MKKQSLFVAVSRDARGGAGFAHADTNLWIDDATWQHLAWSTITTWRVEPRLTAQATSFTRHRSYPARRRPKSTFWQSVLDQQGDWSVHSDRIEFLRYWNECIGRIRHGDSSAHRIYSTTIYSIDPTTGRSRSQVLQRLSPPLADLRPLPEVTCSRVGGRRERCQPTGRCLNGFDRRSIRTRRRLQVSAMCLVLLTMARACSLSLAPKSIASTSATACSRRCSTIPVTDWVTLTAPHSSGRVNTVPEPSTWAMMTLGFAGLGFFGYRAPRKNAPVA